MDGNLFAWTAAAVAGATMLFASAAYAADNEQTGQDVQHNRADDAERRERDDRRGDDQGRRRGDFESLSADQFDTVLEVLQAINPVHAEQLAALRERDPQRFRQAMTASVQGNRLLRWLVRLKQDDQRHFELMVDKLRLENEVRETARDLTQAFNAEAGPQRIDELRDQLQQLLASQYEADLAVDEYQLQKFQEKIQHFRNHLEQRRQEMQTRVAERLQEAVEHARRGRAVEMDDLKEKREDRRDHDSNDDRGKRDDRSGH